MFEQKIKKAKKITKQRLKNIALYYLQRFETSESNLRHVLNRRVNKYMLENPQENKEVFLQWIDEVVKETMIAGYVDDERFAEMKIRGYILAGKPKKYIWQKLKLKGIDDALLQRLLDEQECDEFLLAINFVKKKKLGINPENYQKDLAKLVRAGFDLRTSQKALKNQE